MFYGASPTGNGVTPDKGPAVWESIFPLVPTRFLAGHMRLTYWRTKPEGYTTTLFEETLRFHKAVTLQGDQPITVGFISSGVDNCGVEIRDAAGNLHRGRSKEVATPFIWELGDTGYIRFYHREAASDSLGNTAEGFKQNCSSLFFSLTKGLRFRWDPGRVTLLFTETRYGGYPGQRRVPNTPARGWHTGGLRRGCSGVDRSGLRYQHWPAGVTFNVLGRRLRQAWLLEPNLPSGPRARRLYHRTNGRTFDFEIPAIPQPAVLVLEVVPAHR